MHQIRPVFIYRCDVSETCCADKSYPAAGGGGGRSNEELFCPLYIFCTVVGFVLPSSRTPPLVYCNTASLPYAADPWLASRDRDLRCQCLSCSRPLRTRSRSHRAYRLRRKARERRLHGRSLLPTTSQTPRSLRTIPKKMVAPLPPLHRLTAEAN